MSTDELIRSTEHQDTACTHAKQVLQMSMLTGVTPVLIMSQGIA